MEIITIFLIAVSLAMDAMAVSVSNGIAIIDFKPIHAIKIGIYFGFFQFIMTVIGYVAGNSLSSSIKVYSSFISFILLLLIGSKMLYEAIRNNKEENVEANTAKNLLTAKRLILLAIATSIDALAVGVSLVSLDCNIKLATIIIGIIAFIFSFSGGILGEKIGKLFKQRAEIVGGIILVGIGIKILLEYLKSTGNILK